MSCDAMQGTICPDNLSSLAAFLGHLDLGFQSSPQPTARYFKNGNSGYVSAMILLLRLQQVQPKKLQTE